MNAYENTCDGLVNDYLRAVGQALDGVPAGRRDQVLAELSDHIAAALAGTHASEAEVRSVLELFGDPHDLAAELGAAQLESTAPQAAETPARIEIDPGRKAGALIWVLITGAMASLLCVGVVLAGAFLFFTRR